MIITGSDQEDERRPELYRHNPVLERMNQMLLRNVRDDEPESRASPEPPQYLEPRQPPDTYYETPIQVANVYESVHGSQHYEQIREKEPSKTCIDCAPALPPRPNTEPDYCSISELNLPAERIPRLPQVSEIIIPDEEVKPAPGQVSADNYVRNNTQQRRAKSAPRIQPPPEPPPVIQEPAYDLSQNFEEFKLDEELRDELPPVIGGGTPPPTRRLQLPPAYEHFLECTGLSTKALVAGPRRPFLRPRDVKLRSRARQHQQPP